MRERADERSSGDSGHEVTEEEEERDDFRQRVAQLGYYKILGDPRETLADALRQAGLDLPELKGAVLRFDRDGDRFTLELSREVVIAGVTFGRMVKGTLGDGALEELAGVTSRDRPVGRFPPG